MALPKLLQKLFTNGGAGDKLNQDIIPDIPYSKVTDAPSVDSALSSTSENPVQNKVVNSALDGKLNTSGGTMTGDIIFSSYLAKIANDQNTGGKVEVGQTGAALLSNQENFEGGATLLLRSSTYPNDQRGNFFLIAGLSSSQNYRLIGSPNGSLTWGGEAVERCLDFSFSGLSENIGDEDTYQGYVKFASGFQMCFGCARTTKAGRTITFAKPFTVIPAVYASRASASILQGPYVSADTATTTTISICQSFDANLAVSWLAIGR